MKLLQFPVNPNWEAMCDIKKIANVNDATMLRALLDYVDSVTPEFKSNVHKEMHVQVLSLMKEYRKALIQKEESLESIRDQGE